MTEPIKLPRMPATDGMREYARLAVEQNTAELLDRVAELEKALQMAINQNEHDMLLTGDELRKARAALKEQT